MLGFIESFTNTRFCRICYAGPDEVVILSKKNEILLRTKDKYNDDVSNINVPKTGVKELCVFNKVKNYHVIENASVDAMHDILEGVANYVLAKV